MKKLTKKRLDVIGAAIEVHKIMGRGLLESVYHQCMIEELTLRKIKFVSELKIPALYKTKDLNLNFRRDLFVGDCPVVELKATNDHNPIFEAKLVNYMKLLQAPKGLILNFNYNTIFKDGQKTYVNEYFKLLPEI
ncbi:GxxExxY protein [Sphingobacteriaceae bacterium]|nr:GxxExxY protein [Sphingobacteriaceae bacterium]